MKKISLSGAQPSGNLHIGNYLGAMKNWVDNQDDFENLFFIANLHAITVPQDPKILKEKTYELVAIYLAMGLNTKKTTIFAQSQIPAHGELAWILNTIAKIGELSRMTQFKDKSQKESKESVGVGLFDYPVLMAADILLYQPDIIPVGEDQMQHVELTRTLANRFNNRFGNTLKIPEVMVKKEGMRIMGLDDPSKKMSKSATSPYNYIALIDEPDVIRKKIAKAVTDSGTDIRFDIKRPGLYNLLTIYQLFSEINKQEIEAKFAGKGYGDFKKDLAELLIEKLTPIREKYNELMSDKKYLDQVLADGAKKVTPIAKKTLDEVKKKVGLF